MIPLVELRGAVPVAIASGIPWWQALILCVIGNMLPVPIIFFFARRVLEWGADKPLIGGFFTWCLKKGHSGGQKLEKAAGDKGIFWALLLFVGIPLPGTGPWTGTLAASTQRSSCYAGGYPCRYHHGNTLSSPWCQHLRSLITLLTSGACSDVF